MRKITIVFYLLIALLITLQPLYAVNNEQSLDQIVAVVNDDVITKSELTQSYRMIKTQLQQQGMAIGSERKLKQDVLEQLINKKLQLQIAKQAGIVISDRDLNQAVNNIAEQNQMSINAFYQRLNAEGISKDTYLTEMREQLTIQKLQQQQIISRMMITPEEVKEFSKMMRREKPSVSKAYHLQDILIPFSDDPTHTEVAKAKQMAQTIITKLKKGEPVRAAIKSVGKTQASVRDMGTLELSDLPSAFVNVVPTMQKNDISKPIQTGNGIHLVRVVDVKKRTLATAELSSREIESKLGQKKFEEELQVWLAKLRSQAYIVNKLHD